MKKKIAEEVGPGFEEFIVPDYIKSAIEWMCEE